MIRFVDNIILADTLNKKLGQIKWKTVCGIGMTGVYFITLSLSDRDLFDIYSSAVFKQRGMRKSNLVILGIASSEENARELVAHMIEDYLSKGLDIAGLREYYENYIRDNL